MISFLTLSRRRPLSYRNQSIDLLRKSVDWFLYDNGLPLERVKDLKVCSFSKNTSEMRNIQVKTLRSFAEQKSINYFQMFFLLVNIRSLPKRVFSQSMAIAMTISS